MKMIQGIEHMGLMAKDTKALASWYERVLNFKEIFKTEGENPTIFIADQQGVMIEIFPFKKEVEAPTDNSRQVSHLAMVVNDFDGALKQLESAGVEVVGEPISIFHGGKVIFFKDPEGNWLHLVYRPVKPWEVKA